MPYPAEKPITPSQMNIETEDSGYPVVVISDGRVLESNLRRVGRDRTWLNKRLGELGVKEPERVFLMTVNTAGQVYMAPKEYEH